MKPIIYRITRIWIPNLRPGHHSSTVQIKAEADWPESGVLPKRLVSLQDYEALERALEQANKERADWKRWCLAAERGVPLSSERLQREGT